MKKLLVGLLTLGNLSVQASMVEVNGPLDTALFEAQVVNDEKTHFETLGELFKAGTRPDLRKISNIAWAGRCFLRIGPNKPTNAGYIFRLKRSDAGPNSTPTKAYEAASYWHRNEAPNYYDQMNIDQVYAILRSDFSNVRVKADSVEINFSNLISTMKVSGTYLVEEIVRYNENVGPVGKNNPDIRCYYFIPELN